MENKLIVTDPGNFQFAIQENRTTWEYRQLREGSKLLDEFNNNAMTFANVYNNTSEKMKYSSSRDWYIGSVDVEDYTISEVNDVLNSFGYSLTSEGRVCEDSTNRLLDFDESIQLICECIFETYMFTDFD